MPPAGEVRLLFVTRSDKFISTDKAKGCLKKTALCYWLPLKGKYFSVPVARKDYVASNQTGCVSFQGPL